MNNPRGISSLFSSTTYIAASSYPYFSCWQANNLWPLDSINGLNFFLLLHNLLTLFYYSLSLDWNPFEQRMNSPLHMVIPLVVRFSLHKIEFFSFLYLISSFALSSLKLKAFVSLIFGLWLVLVSLKLLSSELFFLLFFSCYRVYFVSQLHVMTKLIMVQGFIIRHLGITASLIGASYWGLTLFFSYFFPFYFFYIITTFSIGNLLLDSSLFFPIL